MYRLLQSLLFLTLMFLFCSCTKDEISIVKNGRMNFDQTVTLGDVLDNCKGLENRKWTKFETDLKRKVVDFTAEIPVKIDSLTANTPLTTPEIDVLKKVITGPDPIFRLTLQFQIKQNDSFQLTYAGITLKPNIFIGDIVLPDAYKAFVDKGQTYPDPSYLLKQLYQNQEVVPYHLLHQIYFNYQEKQKEIKNKKRQIIGNAFNTFEFPYGLGRVRYLVYLNEEKGTILFGNVVDGILGGAFNRTGGLACSFFEKGNVNETGDKFVFSKPGCSPDIILKNKNSNGTPSIIAVNNAKNCSFCNGAEYLNGEYHAVGYIDLYAEGGISLTLFD
ncbi:hypothetical protein [Desulfovibrio sp. JC022]|uniref:hypothetical protein n=1 Tax=Desulfovibrio sp. JC022 TaxID=2593642 RepID=UPI0013D4AEE3|nr:hypothetical protein [Desulfovibrio sp. JC022]NDV24722.1 hypothetical protein [Desulfovibrio sp. JC022]